MTRITFVDILVTLVNALFRVWLRALPDGERRRLGAVEQLIHDVVERVRAGLWNTAILVWREEAAEQAARCAFCGHASERKEHHTSVWVEGAQLMIPNTSYYCRRCHRTDNPMAQWLGLDRGQVSLGFAHQVVSLSARTSFHEAAEQMRLQHGQEVNVGKVLRVTRIVARDAEVFVAEQQRRATRNLQRLPLRQGVALLIVTTDGGGASVGELVRPEPTKAKALTPVRKLPVGKRPSTHREVRVIIAHSPDEQGKQRAVDVHLSVPFKPVVSGERMLATAAKAGLGAATVIHGVFDMGTWIRPQFIAVFSEYAFTLCADQQHVRTYLKAAASKLFDDLLQRQQWLEQQDGRLRAGRWCSIVDALGSSEQKEVVEARRYLCNHAEDMNNYGQLHARGLPVSSGEAEGAVRHIVRKRLDNAGVWREENVPGMAALLSIWESGEWESFFAWREARDVRAFQARMAPGWTRAFGATSRRREERVAA